MRCKDGRDVRCIGEFVCVDSFFYASNSSVLRKRLVGSCKYDTSATLNKLDGCADLGKKAQGA